MATGGNGRKASPLGTGAGLTFVVGAVQFDHEVVQFLLLQHIDSLMENQNVVLSGVGGRHSVRLGMDQISYCYLPTG